MAGNVEEWCNDDYTQNDNKGYGVNGADTTSLNPVRSLRDKVHRFAEVIAERM